MRAFLSHSSKDKGYVESVATMLRPGTFELDSETFDLGSINSQAIVSALERCDLFCLFLSSQSAISPYVDFETLLGIESVASGNVSRFLAICLDETAFETAPERAKHFNIVRYIPHPDTTARMIEGHLISLATATDRNVFIGREDELKELGHQITDHSRPPSKALYLSGNYGAGRRTIARKIYRDYFPHVTQVFPVLRIGPFAGLDELFRTVLGSLRPTIRAEELLARIEDFNVATCGQRAQIVASELNALLHVREAAFVIDDGGLLTDSGGLVREINDVLDHLSSKPHPPVVFVSPRMIPRRLRRPANDVSYLAVRSLSREATERIISALLRNEGLTVNEEELEQLVDLSDSHPFNIYRMIEEISDSNHSTFLASPADFIDWKHRQSSEYVGRMNLTHTDVQLLSILNLVPELDFTSIVNVLEADGGAVSDALLRLVGLHIVESVSDRFMIAPAVRVAVERDRRIRLPVEARRGLVRRLATSLSMRLEEGTAPVVLIDSTILACLQGSDQMPEIVGAFLLPSHYVWMANNHYNSRRWSDCIRYGKKALERTDRLSARGIVAACRLLCLAAARLGNQRAFSEGIARLESTADDEWAKSNIAFLNGFNLRLKGRLPGAEEFFRLAYRYSPGNFSAARELAAVCLARGSLDESERFAREAHERAPRNPYVVDILVSVLIRRTRESGNRDNVELDDMFRLLEQVGEEGGRSFYTTRRAEFEHLCGDNEKATELIEKAVEMTPGLFEPRRLHAEILLKAGNLVKARDVMSTMETMVNSRSPDDGRGNLRQYLQTKAHYLTEMGRYTEAKSVFSNNRVFTKEEREAEVREVGLVEGFRMR
ncbi:MAG: hypothetical protein F4X98_12710 [Gammaproteobacteria bacterium]|nr:hypothetical protein [Gammaproteobacteria bacterium]